ncbi:hypothetical protein OE88DRAFT_1660194 [Heliocybe sulcata]|uniref:Uncharacterized protein n=1 Tax=Heliocybe sulcata TaxID=5364 RepID=A0A5C3N1S4_9AGAM|nr:hypothetical protein OE88DRAFT_1660194 [Heliocybe sulcata]
MRLRRMYARDADAAFCASQVLQAGTHCAMSSREGPTQSEALPGTAAYPFLKSGMDTRPKAQLTTSNIRLGVPRASPMRV